MNDNEKSALLGKILRREGIGGEVFELAGRLRKGEWRKGDVERWKRYEAEIDKTLAEAEHIEKFAKSEGFGAIVEASPKGLKRLEGVIGREGIVSSLEASLKGVAADNPPRFKRILDNLQKLEEGQKNLQARKQEMVRRARELNVTSEVLERINRETDDLSRYDELQDAIVAGMRGWKGIKVRWGFLNNKNINELENHIASLNTLEELDQLNNDIKEAQKGLGKVFSEGLTETGEGQRVMNEYFKEGAVTSIEEGNIGFGEMQKIVKRFDAEKADPEMINAWDEFRRSDKEWAAADSDAKKILLRDSFFDKYLASASKKRGFWADFSRQYLQIKNRKALTL